MSSRKALPRRAKRTSETQYDDTAIALVCHYLCEGMTASEIAHRITEAHGIPMNSQDPFRLIRRATREKHWLHFISPWDNRLSEIIHKTFDVNRVEVTLTSFVEDVAARAAFMILDLLRELRREPTNKSEVHIGFSGGHTTRKVFQKLAHLLVEPSDSLPDNIVCHALVAGFDAAAPGTDPTSFFTYLADRTTSVATSFVLFHAPPLVQSSQIGTLRASKPIEKAILLAKRLDVIVTSAAVFGDPHSQLKKNFLEYSPETVAGLERDGCIGDMLWLPISNNGPMDTSRYEYRPVTLIELDELPERIACGQKVVLVLGPCADPAQAQCELKSAILNTILKFHLEGKKYVTHLVIDKDTARDLIPKPLLAAHKAAAASAVTTAPVTSP